MIVAFILAPHPDSPKINYSHYNLMGAYTWVRVTQLAWAIYSLGW